MNGKHTATPHDRNPKMDMDYLTENEIPTKSKVILVILFIIASFLSCILFKRYLQVTNAVEAFNEEFSFEVTDEYPVRYEGGKYLTKSGFVIATDPLPKNPNWYIAGQNDIKENKVTEESKFAGKCEIISGKYSKSANTFKALAECYFNGDCSEMQMEEIKNTIAYLNTHLVEEKK